MKIKWDIVNERAWWNTFWELLRIVFYRRLTLADGEGNGTPLQYSCLENPMDGGAWWAAVHGVTKSRTRLSDFTFTFHFHTLEKEMTTHSSILAWRIPGTEEPSGLPSMGSHRVGRDWRDLAAAAWQDSALQSEALFLLHCHVYRVQRRHRHRTLGSLLVMLPFH